VFEGAETAIVMTSVTIISLAARGERRGIWPSSCVRSAESISVRQANGLGRSLSYGPGEPYPVILSE
jgi:hypothetical protein